MDQNVNGVNDHIACDQLGGLVDAAGVDGAREILDAFWRSTDDMLGQLSLQISEGDLTTSAQTCHAIKGMAANVGAARLSATVAEIEIACKADDAATALSKVADARSDFDAAHTSIQDYLLKAS